MAGFIFVDDESKRQIEGRFWNSQGINVAIVASITKGVDWAAYIGGNRAAAEINALHDVASGGSKLSVEDARYFFPVSKYPELKGLPYRH